MAEKTKIPAGTDKFIQMAHAAGVPSDQLNNFKRAQYLPLPWSLPVHAAARQADEVDGPTMIAAGGARGPGKSHMFMAQLGLDDCQRAPGLKVLFLRRVLKSAEESFDDLIRKVFGHVEHNFVNGQVKFPNGSKILVGGYNYEKDIDSYLGIEYDAIALEEGTQITGDKRNKMMGSLRTSRNDWRARWYESTNPGGVGHLDFKKLYVMPWREKRETRTRFFPATYRDNPFLKPEYIDYLVNLPDPLGKAWRDGDWDVFEGQAFGTFNYEVHVIKPFSIPAGWMKWRSIDWGYRNPFCCLWLTKDPDTGRVFVYREVYERGLTDRQQARLIKDSTPEGERINVTYADPSMWAKKNMEDKVRSTADEYAAEGVILTKADNDRIIGKRKVDQLLANLPDGLPGMQIFETCYDLVRTLPALPYSIIHPEDIDTDTEDHAYDTLRYGVTQVNLRVPDKAKDAQMADRIVQRTRERGLVGKDF